jgi:hypothetical protein
VPGAVAGRADAREARAARGVAPARVLRASVTEVGGREAGSGVAAGAAGVAAGPDVAAGPGMAVVGGLGVAGVVCGLGRIPIAEPIRRARLGRERGA